jgi:hypothetical protein
MLILNLVIVPILLVCFASVLAETTSNVTTTTTTRTMSSTESVQSCPYGWKMASGTIYDSWPKPGSVECIDYSGCEWAGQFSTLDSGSEQCCCKNGAQWLDGGDGVMKCRLPPTIVRKKRVIATYDLDNVLLNKKIQIRIAGTNKYVTGNVLDVCNDDDCDGCCKANSSNKRYKLLDVEAQLASLLLGLDYTDPNFDVNNLDTPSNKRYKANPNTIPLCYKVIGKADSF